MKYAVKRQQYYINRQPVLWLCYDEDVNGMGPGFYWGSKNQRHFFETEQEAQKHIENRTGDVYLQSGQFHEDEEFLVPVRR